MKCSQIYARSIAFLSCTLWALAGAAFGQSTLGVVLGTVKDASGGVVNGAKVILTNSGENTARKGTTNADGNFEFPSAKPGSYAVSVTQLGFRTFTATAVQIDARQTVSVDADSRQCV